MSGMTNGPADPILGARRRLQAIIDSSADGDSSVYLQQVAHAGLLALDTLPSCPEAQLLAGNIAQQVDNISNPLQNVTRVDEGLKNDLTEFLGAITQIQEEISRGAAAEKLAAFGDNLQKLSERVVRHIVASGVSELAIATEEEAGGPSTHYTLPLQTTNDDNSSMPTFPDLTNSPPGTNMPEGDAANLSSQSIAAERTTPLLHQFQELPETTVADIDPAGLFPTSSGMLVDLGGSILHHNQTLTAEETYGLGVDLLKLFMHEGDLRNLSSSISLFRGSLVLCSPESQLRLVATGNLANALLTRYEHAGDYPDLLEAITQFYEVLNLCPSGHPTRGTTFCNLSSALMARYQCEGSLQDLSEATERCQEGLQLLPSDNPGRAVGLNILSNALLIRYQREGSLQDLTEATEGYREALQLCPPGHPDRDMSLINLSNILLARYRREGSLEDLSEATEHCREALQLLPPGHPDRASCLISLSNALMARYHREGSLQDLSEAIEQRRETLQLHPSHHPDRSLSLNNLSNALLTRYQREGSLQDLSEATECHREALQLRPPSHPERAMSLNNLSNTLLTRYEREGSLQDLAEATECYREALQLCPPGHPERAMSLNNLSNALWNRYKREGSLQDLSEATEHYRKALQQRPSGRPDRALGLTNLSNALLSRYRREGDLQDLEEATEGYREALQLCAPGHPDRPLSLNNLSNALWARYRREGSLQDLSEATEGYREALQLCLPGHPDRGMSLSNLSNTLIARYKREGCLYDLSEAIGYRREALELRPRGHLERTNSLSTLSSALLLYVIRGVDDVHDILPDQTLVQEVLAMLREAVDLPDCPPLARLQAALQWIDTTRRLAPTSMLNAYSAALDQLDIVLATRDTLENKHTQLMSSKELLRCRRLGIEAASYAVRQGHMDLAVELLERGRNLLFAQVGRYRVDLDDLRKENAKLAEQFSALSGLLDASVVSNRPTLEGRTAFEDPIERYRRVSSAWNQIVDDIRAVQGFKHFLQSPAFSTLRTAADEGPVIIVIPGDDQSDALIITEGCDKPRHVNLPNAGMPELQELHRNLVQAVGSDEGATTEKSVKKILRSLWDFVVRPIVDALQNELHIPPHSRIWWCPTGLFSSLPLHAAGRYAPNNTNQNLPDRYVSSYTPTLQALLRGRRNRNVSKGDKMLIVAQPDTPGQDELRNALPEAKGVKATAEERMKIETTLLSSKEGTPTAVLDRMVDHSWIHLTCHGIQDPANPFDSRVCLYGGELTLQHIMRRGLPDAKFAFLAACHTATGDRELLDEGLHLAAGLQFAGFKSVVGTIWEIADIDGPVIAEAFYEALRPEGPDEEGMDCSRAAHALNQAVKKLRDSGVPISRWMRFIHIGI